MKKSTQSSYRQRLTKVIDYIYANIDGKLDVNTLAEVACMSPYHFHRIYRELAQETVNVTVRKLRLQKAVADLIRTDQPLNQVASNFGYASTEAFTRAFSAHFGESPGAYRQRKANEEIVLVPFVAMLPPSQQENTVMYSVEIIDVEAITLIGIDYQGDYMDIGSAFEKLYMYAGTHQLMNEQTRSFGLYYDDPQSVEVDDLRSVACISYEGEVQLTDDSFRKLTIPAGKRVNLTFQGAYAELEKPYDYLFGQWVPENDLQLADFPPFEEYLNDPKTTAPNELLTRINGLLV